MWKNLQKLGIHEIKIETYDNPGWGIQLYFEDIISYNRQIIFSNNLASDDWLLQIVDRNMLDTIGSSEILAEIVHLILKYLNVSCEYFESMSPYLEWLSYWYSSHCDGNWEHTYGVCMERFINTEWSLKIDLEGTYLEDAEFNSPNLEEVECFIERDEFISKFNGYSKDLKTLISVFKSWVEQYNPSGFQEVKGYDGVGKGHTNSVTKKKIETPHLYLITTHK